MKDNLFGWNESIAAHCLQQMSELIGVWFGWLSDVAGYGRCSANGSAKKSERQQTNQTKRRSEGRNELNEESNLLN